VLLGRRGRGGVELFFPSSLFWGVDLLIDRVCEMAATTGKDIPVQV